MEQKIEDYHNFHEPFANGLFVKRYSFKRCFSTMEFLKFEKAHFFKFHLAKFILKSSMIPN
jgi:hypothetical protein